MSYLLPNINNFYRSIKNISGELCVSFSGNYFVQNIINISNNVINIYCVYKLDPIDFSRNNKFTIQDALFGAIKITKNGNTSKYKYKGYSICFDESEEFTHVRKEGNFNHITSARNVIIFGADMSFTDPGHKFILSLHYNGDNSYLFVNGIEELKFKTKNNQIINTNLCLGNIY